MAAPGITKRSFRRGRVYTRVGRFRSTFESKLAEALDKAGVAYEYETLKLSYSIPAVEKTYRPDFVLPNGIILEAKGLFDASDRKKMLLVREAHPELDIRLVFYNSNNKICHGSKTTLASWAEAHGFLWAHRAIPEGWLKEKT